MFEDLIGRLDEWAQLGRQIPSTHMLERHIRLNIRQCVQNRMKDIMLDEVTRAISMVNEFQYEPLRQRLIRNFEDDRHYWISDNLTDFRVVNESIAGTRSDLIEGQRAAWGPNTAGATQEQRLFVWKSGIYKPGREGKSQLKKFENLPSYDEIMAIRLRTWGQKAPYWILLNDGNAGGAPAYPTFEGTNFVEKARARVRRAVVECTEAATSRLVSDIEYVVEEVVRQQDTRTYVGRAYGHNISIQRQSWGYQLVIDGKFDKRIYPGERILIEGRFTGFRFGGE